LKDSQNDEKSGIIFNVFRQLDHIRDDFLRIQREIQVVHTQQGIKNVRLEKLLIDSSVFEQKVNKFQQKVAGLNENIRKSEKIVEKLENVQKGLEKGEERCRDILAKLTEVENLKGFKEFLDFSR
jgi:predicted translin family RNA/ssDNA-binding protein